MNFLAGGTLNCCGDYSYLEADMNNIIYIIGLIVVIGAVLAFFGLR